MKGSEQYDVVVMGGGAAGMMAAGRAAERGKRVLLLEKNARLGEKLRITGGGRCNITNAEEDTHALLSHYGEAEPFLHSSFAQFGMKDTFAFFEGWNLPLKVEARKRAFPTSEKAADVSRTLEQYLAQGKVTMRTKAPLTNIAHKNGAIASITAGGKEYAADAFILATGGVSHPETGSTGDGFAWLARLGHTVVTPTPTIVPLKAKEPWIKDLSGKSLPDAKISFFVEGESKKRFSEQGTILLTHFGLSGPTILNASSKVSDLLHEGKVTARIDTVPALDLGLLERRMTEVFDANKNKALKNVFKQLAPEGTSEVLLSLVPSVDPEKKTHSITREERRALAEMLKGLPVTVSGLMGYDRAVVADGGVPLTEMDPKTFRSLKVPNLYIIGDLLHIRRPSGGYSLQLCWTTGQVAGNSV